MIYKILLSAVFCLPAQSQEVDSPRVTALLQKLHLTPSQAAAERRRFNSELEASLPAACTRHPMVVSHLTNFFDQALRLRWTAVRAKTSSGLLGVRYLLAQDELGDAAEVLRQDELRLGIKKTMETSFRRPAADLGEAISNSENRVERARARLAKTRAEKERLELYVLMGMLGDVGPSGILSLGLEKGVDYDVVDCPPAR